MSKYNIPPDQIYNIDEKGFLLGQLSKSKRVFSKAKWDRREVREALQDGSREFITVLACVCGNGTSLEPSVIFAGKSGLCSAWVEAVEEGKHEVFSAILRLVGQTMSSAFAGSNRSSIGSQMRKLDEVGDSSSSTARAVMLPWNFGNFALQIASICSSFPPIQPTACSPLMW
jgi:hypothetical protein